MAASTGSQPNFGPTKLGRKFALTEVNGFSSNLVSKRNRAHSWTPFFCQTMSNPISYLQSEARSLSHIRTDFVRENIIISRAAQQILMLF